jgi:hypothetical protein
MCRPIEMLSVRVLMLYRKWRWALFDLILQQGRLLLTTGVMETQGKWRTILMMMMLMSKKDTPINKTMGQKTVCL